MKRAVSLILAGSLAASSAAATTLTGKGNGFGGGDQLRQVHPDR